MRGGIAGGFSCFFYSVLFEFLPQILELLYNSQAINTLHVALHNG